jgi:phosphatidate cytidylyltransferase
MSRFFDIMNIWQWIGVAAVVVASGTLGDLVESSMKREMQIKDSSNILPGHGGMLDRFDSTLLAIPCVLIYLNLIGVL